jgi:putative tricarboxylic transport membrane protein
VGLAYLLAALAVPRASVGDPLGPVAFPAVLGGMMLLLGFSFLIAPEKDAASEGLKGKLSVVLIAGLLAVYGYSLPYVGYPLGTFLFIWITARLMGERSWTLGLSLSAGLSVIIYLLFTQVLDVPLPLGALVFLKG